MNVKNRNPSAAELESGSYRNRIKTYSAADDYLRRRQLKHRAEVRLVERSLKYLPKGTPVLDAPCGNGRMSVLLARRGHRVTGCDLSEYTLKNAREAFAERGLSGEFVPRDMEALAFKDKQFEATLCFRFFHHLPDATVRTRVVDELCRVTRKAILISYLQPYSPTMLKRRVRHHFGGRASRQYATHLEDLEALFDAHRYELREDFAQLRYFKSLHLACFVSR